MVNRNTIGPSEKVKIFDPRITSEGSIYDNFRIFTNPTKKNTRISKT